MTVFLMTQSNRTVSSYYSTHTELFAFHTTHERLVNKLIVKHCCSECNPGGIIVSRSTLTIIATLRAIHGACACTLSGNVSSLQEGLKLDSSALAHLHCLSRTVCPEHLLLKGGVRHCMSVDLQAHEQCQLPGRVP